MTGEPVPDVGELLRERYHPIITGIRELPEPVVLRDGRRV